MAIYKIRKRNGTITTFDRLKIEAAIAKAIEAAGGTDYSQVSRITDRVIEKVEQNTSETIPSIESIQDAIEEMLIKE